MIIENANMSDMISKMSGKNGDIPAFVCEENGERTVHTYRCFASDVKSRAAVLKEQGHTCIGIVCILGYETIVEIFAANLAGLQVVMLSPALSGDQIQGIIRDVKSEHIAEYQRHHAHHQQRVQQAPHIPQKAAPVFDLQIPANQFL